MTTSTGAGGLIGHRVLDSNGSSVGKIGQVYYDDNTDVAKWVTVRTGLFGTRESFVPLQGARSAEEAIQVPYDKQTIKNAPHFDVGQRISMEEERRIYEHYGLPYSGVPEQRGSAEETGGAAEGSGRHEASSAATMSTRAGTGGAEAAPSAAGEPGAQAGMGAEAAPDAGAGAAAGPEAAARPGAETGAGTDAAVMTRFEEQVRVHAEPAEASHLHLRKYVETEEFEETVPVTHEEVTIEREPVDGSELGDTRMETEDQEITLRAESATVSKESVPVERVRVRKHQVTQEQTVRGERRMERVELEGDESADSPEPAQSAESPESSAE
ncbi:hypothetical protein GCM10027570_00040 [Streptomonospora sediminis]